MGEFHDYIFNWSNPVIYIIVFWAILMLITFVIIKFIVLPNQKKHIEDKIELKRKNQTLLALMAELDPDPIMRVNQDGFIAMSNKSAHEQFSLDENVRVHFADIVEGFELDWRKFIKSNETMRTSYQFSDRHYLIDLKGIDELNVAQVYFHDITDRVLYENEVDNYKNRLRVLSEHLDTQLEEVRETVSQTLHDDISQQIFALKLQLQRDENKLHDVIHLSDYLEQLNKIYNSIRTLSHDLKPVQSTNLSLIQSLNDLVYHFNEISQIKGEIMCADEEIELSNRLRTCIFRVCQEAITNILKHSEATKYILQISVWEKEIRVIISDNGKGMMKEKIATLQHFKSGIGLFNMKERVEYLNGRIQIDSVQNEGFTIYVTLPKV